MSDAVENCNHPSPKIRHRLADPSVCESGRKKVLWPFTVTEKCPPEELELMKTLNFRCHKTNCIYNSQNPDNKTPAPTQ